MARFGKKKKKHIIDAEIVVPEELVDDKSDLEKKFEEKGKNIGRKAGKVLHDSKVKADNLKGKIKEKNISGKVKNQSEKIKNKVKEKISKK